VLDIARHDQQRAVSGLRDDIGQALTGISLMLRTLTTDIAERAPARVPDVEQLIGLVNRSIGACRSLAKGLSPVSLDHGGLITALRELAEVYVEARGIPILIRERGPCSSAIDEAIAGHLFRIAQDAVVRAIEHGGVSQVLVCLGMRRDTVILTITGDGCRLGVCHAEKDLNIMRRRAKLAGAAIEIVPRLRGGTRVRCSLQLSSASRARGSSAAPRNP
jgi:signal transduction histidine kinase